MTDQKVRIVLSFIVIGFYLALVFIVLQHETFGESGPHDHPDNMMGELKILIGVLTAGVGQILSYWFSKKNQE
jgi:protein-S-isoprenylcysteine O-methyltransferase Ste14